MVSRYDIDRNYSELSYFEHLEKQDGLGAVDFADYVASSVVRSKSVGILAEVLLL